MKRTALALLAVLALVGCVAIPDAGPVVEGQVDTSEQTNDLVFLAPEPQPGATQEEIILGFLAAAITPGEDYAIAREYLSEEAADGWDPSARVIVRSGAPPELSLTGDTAANAVVSGLSEVDARGALQLTGDDRMLEFALEMVDGEWRIAEAPDGIVLTAYYFNALFRAHTLHWLTQDGTRTVPEVRWFARTATTLSERIIDALLAGPSTWLSPAVSTFGAVEASRVGQSRVDGTTMTITLNSPQVDQLGPGSLSPLAAQLALSLREVGVREVLVEVEGREGLVASSADAAIIDEGDVDPQPLVLEGTSLHPVGGSAPVPDDVGATLAAIGATSYTVGAEGGVAHTGTTAAWILPGAEPVVISTDAGVAPTVDDSGWVLLQEVAAAPRLLAWRGGERTELPLPPGLARIAAMELARDGSRLALVTGEEGDSRAWVLAVVRDASGRPVALGEPYPLPAIEGAASDVTWVSPTQVAVLSSADDQAQIAMLAVGGVSEQLPAPGEPVQAIAGGSQGISTLRALSADGALLSLQGRVWSPAAGLEPLRLIATQQ
ncbi:LpqB family beta-propeller domain-containing protein [Agrococcus sp. ARC_14]|uniref:LpqB family beta-propeller domain-containing protein n=1 Tax=Agrococcus sp. ARC_14 TaxID=2919927 RepID=UPI001F0613CF|nr:LpqB family beta-propeller domain-containing protein [Agrococcus sp. ARC_14]MCH1883844.1 LpqB family beta-propeller domain-containing protein [Agrococcus sp. ARC_14]